MLLYMERCIEFYVKSLCDILLLNVVKFRLLWSIWLEGVEKWNGRIENILFSLLFFFSWEWKSGGVKKMSLNKFTHLPLLKNDAKLNFFFLNVTNNHTKKSNHPKIFIKIKNMFQKKSHPVKNKN